MPHHRRPPISPNDPPPENWRQLSLEEIRRQPVAVRWAIWMAYGAAFDLTVNGLFATINQQLNVAKVTLAGKRLRWNTAQRLLHASHLRRIPGVIRSFIRWIATPEGVIRACKRFQERHANGGGETNRNKLGRP